MDPFRLAEGAGIPLIPFSAIQSNPGWFPPDLPSRLQMSCAVTLSYPSFCIVFRDDLVSTNRLRFTLCHELGHLFMNHYRDFATSFDPGSVPDSGLEEEADAFARNLLAPVPIVDVIRYNRPRQARGEVFGLTRSAWIARLDVLADDRSFVTEDLANTLIYLYRDFLLGRRCAACGHRYTDEDQLDRCPRCGAMSPEWTLGSAN